MTTLTDTPDVADEHPALPPSIGTLPGLTGLRGSAVVAVVAYHLGYLPGGFVGVDLFFVLSGFIIAHATRGQLGRPAAVRIQLRHLLHRRPGMGEEPVQALAQVVVARFAIARQHFPAIELAVGHAIGDAQRLDGRDEGHHREERHQQEADGYSLFAGWGRGHHLRRHR